MSDLEAIIINPDNPPIQSVIWLHGLGADGNDFAPIVPQLTNTKSNTRFIFPHAPIRPVTINNNMEMRAWYDIKGLKLADKQDREGITQSQELINKLINQEIKSGIKSNRIYLVGFSQGAAMALHAGLRYPEPLAGIIALSGYLPLHESLLEEKSAENQQTPILQCHGLYDEVVPMFLAEMTQKYLLDQNYNLTYQTYPMAHELAWEELLAIDGFLVG